MKTTNMDYSRLRCRMKEKGYTQRSLAKEIGTCESQLSTKFSNRFEFTQTEIVKIVEVLDIAPYEIGNYFFRPLPVLDYTVNLLIREHIEKTGQRQLAVAEKAGIEPYVFFEMMKCERIIYAHELFPIVSAAGIDPVELYGIDALMDNGRGINAVCSYGWSILSNDDYEVAKAYAKLPVVEMKNIIRGALSLPLLTKEE